MEAFLTFLIDLGQRQPEFLRLDHLDKAFERHVDHRFETRGWEEFLDHRPLPHAVHLECTRSWDDGTDGPTGPAKACPTRHWHLRQPRTDDGDEDDNDEDAKLPPQKEDDEESEES